MSVAFPSYDLGSRPLSEQVGARSPQLYSYDVFDNTPATATATTGAIRTF